ncbi:hypothetical protein [Flavobacterium sp.]|uniref:hypothetical protein n=1 Tax=Flavobacterium sp. TaxID=239 RepID=UPI0025BAE8FE|nr:hypothetical protein [Flavobacterium sp.]MBA4153772.1 hypothetical protein [Flavobacterium sp.]
MEASGFNYKNLVCWILGFWFLVISFFNFLLVHPVPGLFYLFFSLLFFPFITRLIFRTLHIQIPFYVQLFLALVVMWGTLAVTDLADIAGL